MIAVNWVFGPKEGHRESLFRDKSTNCEMHIFYKLGR